MNEVVDPLVLVIIGVVAIAVATAIGPKLNIAGPLILMLLGLGVSLLPFVAPFTIDPEIILVGVLPPLLYSAAVSLPAIEFRRDFAPIAGLSVILVVLSAVALAFFFVAVIPGIPFLLAVALGAILSPTDAVATSIVKRLGISRRVTTLLEGESLLNDATSLIILRVAVAGIAAGGAFTPGQFIGAFAWGALVAVVIGAIVGYVNLRLRSLVRHSAANTAIGFVVPFAAYLPTEQLGGSGLVAAVVAGIVTGQGSTRWFTPEQRLSDELNWRTIELVLEGAVFLVMGLELKDILDQNLKGEHGIGEGLWVALVALAIVLVVRALWVSVLLFIQRRRIPADQRVRLEKFGAHLDELEADPEKAIADREAAGRAPRGRAPEPERVQKRVSMARRRLARAFADLNYYQASPLGWKHGTVIVWAGMRGVVTLAAAQTLPRDTFERPLLVFIAFLVAVGSLAIQGFTLPGVVRMLHLGNGESDEIDRRDQRSIDDELRDAAASAVAASKLTRRDGSEFPAGFTESMGARFAQPPDEDVTAAALEMLELRLAVIRTMRQRLLELSSGGEYSTEALRHALAELDADEISLQLRLEDQD